MNNTIVFRKYNLPVDLPVVAFVGDNWIAPDRTAVSMHFHNCIEIGFCKKNTGILMIDGEQFSVSQGDFFIVPAYMPHITKSKENSAVFEYLMFDPELLFSGINENFAASSRIVSFSPREFCPVLQASCDPASVSFPLMQVINQLQSGNELSKEAARGFLLAFIIKLCRILPDNSNISHSILLPIMPAIHYIQQHYMDDLTLEQISQVCNISVSHFRRLFHSCVHCSPQEYWNRVRINQACVLLSMTDCPVHDIARRTGFNTLSSFNRSFHTLKEMSPSAWRLKAQKTKLSHCFDSTESLKNSSLIFL